MIADDTARPAPGIFSLSASAVREYGIYIALVLLIAYFSVRVPEFRTWDNALLILLQVSVIGVIAVGMTFTIITAGINQANRTRAAIRLPLDSRTRMVFAVTDQTGAILGLYRMPDATVFSIDVAVAKARNVAYYADPTQLQPIDNPGVPVGTAKSTPLCMRV